MTYHCCRSNQSSLRTSGGGSFRSQAASFRHAFLNASIEIAPFEVKP